MPRPEIRPEWMDEARCSKVGPGPFFPEGNDYSDVSEARSICKTCPVWRECLSFAVKTKQQFGVWAGSTPYQRRKLRQQWRQTGEIDDGYKGSPARR